MSKEWADKHIAEVKTFYEMSQHTDWLRGVTIGLQAIEQIEQLKDQLTDARSDRNSEVAQLRADLRIARNSWEFDEGKKVIAQRNEALADAAMEAARARKLEVKLKAAQIAADDEAALANDLQAKLTPARNSWNFDEGKRIIAERDELRRENELFRAAASKWEIRAKTAIAAGEKRIEELEVQLKDEKYNSQHWFNRHSEVVKQYHMEADRVDATEAEAQIEVARLRTQFTDMRAHIKEAVDCLWQIRVNSKRAARVLVKLRRWDYESGQEEEPKVNFKYHDIDDL